MFVLQSETRVGLYVEFLQDWFSVFPREQFIIQRLEDYHSNRSAVLNKIFKHIGIGMLEVMFYLLVILTIEFSVISLTHCHTMEVNQ